MQEVSALRVELQSIKSQFTNVASVCMLVVAVSGRGQTDTTETTHGRTHKHI